MCNKAKAGNVQNGLAAGESGPDSYPDRFEGWFLQALIGTSIVTPGRCDTIQR
jgi:hypothetical protein